MLIPTTTVTHTAAPVACDPAAGDHQQAPIATKAVPRLGSTPGAGNTGAAVTAGASAGRTQGYQVGVRYQTASCACLPVQGAEWTRRIAHNSTKGSAYLRNDCSPLLTPQISQLDPPRPGPPPHGMQSPQGYGARLSSNTFSSTINPTLALHNRTGSVGGGGSAEPTGSTSGGGGSGGQAVARSFGGAVTPAQGPDHAFMYELACAGAGNPRAFVPCTSSLSDSRRVHVREIRASLDSPVSGKTRAAAVPADAPGMAAAALGSSAQPPGAVGQAATRGSAHDAHPSRARHKPTTLTGVRREGGLYMTLMPASDGTRSGSTLAPSSGGSGGGGAGSGQGGWRLGSAGGGSTPALPMPQLPASLQLRRGALDGSMAGAIESPRLPTAHITSGVQKGCGDG